MRALFYESYESYQVNLTFLRLEQVVSIEQPSDLLFFRSSLGYTEKVEEYDWLEATKKKVVKHFVKNNFVAAAASLCNMES